MPSLRQASLTLPSVSAKVSIFSWCSANLRSLLAAIALSPSLLIMPRLVREEDLLYKLYARDGISVC